MKSGHLRTQGEGGSVAKSGRPQIEIFCQNFRSFNSVLCAKRRKRNKPEGAFLAVKRNKTELEGTFLAGKRNFQGTSQPFRDCVNSLLDLILVWPCNQGPYLQPYDI